MKKMYFIIRAKGWYACEVKGTMKELKDFLSSICSKILETQDTYVEDAHLVYRKRIVTQTNALGFNRELYDNLLSEISGRLSSLNKVAYSIHKDSIERALMDVCDDAPTKSDRIDILVSDGEEYQLPPNHFCAYRTFYDFSDICLEDFCRFVRDHAYIKIGTCIK